MYLRSCHALYSVYRSNRTFLGFEPCENECTVNLSPHLSVAQSSRLHKVVVEEYLQRAMHTTHGISSQASKWHLRACLLL